MGTIIRSRVGLTANNPAAERKRIESESVLLAGPFESSTLINVARVTHILSLVESSRFYGKKLKKLFDLS